MSHQATDINWNAIESQIVHDNGEPLIQLSPHPCLQLQPIYFQLNIAGALPNIYVRQSVAEKLMRVAFRLPENMALLVLDGWRPLAVQRALREQMRQELMAKYPQENAAQITQRLDCFATDPDRATLCPPHFTGGSVDVTLADTHSGKPLDMGGAFDETGDISYTMALADLPNFQAAHARRMILLNAMSAEGFTNLPTEWWHFDFGNANWAFFGGNAYAIYGATQPETR